MKDYSDLFINCPVLIVDNNNKGYTEATINGVVTIALEGDKTQQEIEYKDTNGNTFITAGLVLKDTPNMRDVLSFLDSYFGSASNRF